MLLEHFAGALPVWLSPVQAVIVPIADRHLDYADSLLDRLRRAGLRAEVDRRAERMQAKIREAQLRKIPYILVVGRQEAEVGEVNVRLRDGAIAGSMTPEAFIERVRDEERATRG